MKFLANSFKLTGIIALLAFAAACATTPNYHSKENLLAAAGFKPKSPGTPQQKAHFQSLPDGKIKMVVRKGKTYYVMADKTQGVVYVGTPAQFQYFQQLKEVRDDISHDVNYAHSEVDTSSAWGGWGDWEDSVYDY